MKNWENSNASVYLLPISADGFAKSGRLYIFIYFFPPTRPATQMCLWKFYDPVRAPGHSVVSIDSIDAIWQAAANDNKS